MDIRIQKIIEGLFCLEDLREVYRGALPTGLSPEEEVVFGAKIDDLERIVDEIRTGTGQPKVTRARPARSSSGLREEAAINIQPIQAAGRLTLEARKAVISLRRRLLDLRRLPQALPARQDLQAADRHVPPGARGVRRAWTRPGSCPGARRGFQAVASSLVQKGDPVIALGPRPLHRVPGGRAGRRDSSARCPRSTRGICHGRRDGRERLEEVVRETREDARARDDATTSTTSSRTSTRWPGLRGSPTSTMCCSCTMGAVHGRRDARRREGDRADFVVGSGHKSMASPAPSGVLAANDEYAERVFRTTENRGRPDEADLRRQGG